MYGIVCCIYFDSNRMIGYACAVMDSYAKHVFISVQEIPFSSHDIPNIQLVALCVRSNAGPCLPQKQQQKLLFALDKFFFLRISIDIIIYDNKIVIKLGIAVV